MKRNRLIKKYISVCKSLFPAIGKPEREYLKKLKKDIIESTYHISLDSIDDLYSQFGTPEEILKNYYLMYDTSILIEKVRSATIIRHVVSFILVFLIIGIMYYVFYLYNTYTSIAYSEIMSYEETIK